MLTFVGAVLTKDRVSAEDGDGLDSWSRKVRSWTRVEKDMAIDGGEPLDRANYSYSFLAQQWPVIDRNG